VLTHAWRSGNICILMRSLSIEIAQVTVVASATLAGKERFLYNFFAPNKFANQVVKI